MKSDHCPSQASCHALEPLKALPGITALARLHTALRLSLPLFLPPLLVLLDVVVLAPVAGFYAEELNKGDLDLGGRKEGGSFVTRSRPIFRVVPVLVDVSLSG